MAQDRLVLDSYFIHQRMVLSLLGEARARRVSVEIGRWLAANEWLPATIPAHVTTQHFRRFISSYPVPELVPALNRGDLQVGQLVGHTQAFYFRRSKSVSRRIEFHAKLSVDPSVRLQGHLSDEHCVGTSGRDNLSGRVRVHIVGHITDITDETISLRPLFVGHRFFQPVEFLPGIYLEDRRRVHPEQIDEFARMRVIKGGTKEDLKVLRDVPEETLKLWFAQIIGEPIVPKDHGGELSDLYSSRAHVEGEPTSIAFLLKGPSFFRPMTIAALGKPGNQIDRLFKEPADLLVLQHCHEIRAAVVSMMETYAWDSRRPRRFAIIDGHDTVRILRAYEKI